MFEDTYKTISSASTGEIREKGSRFLAYAYPVTSEESVKKLLQEIKKAHPKANHYCYAFRLGPLKSAYRFSDDREPAGTAGKPIYGVIQSNNLTDTLIIVVRYFGGTLLGVPGLIKAYRSAAADAIVHAHISEIPITENLTVSSGYENLGEITGLLRIAGGKYTIQESGEKCVISAVFPKGTKNQFIEKIINDPRYAGKYDINHE